jgi:acetyl esterase/lipase
MLSMLARRHPRRGAPVSDAPHVQLGTLAEGGLAPAIMAIVERGVRRHPALAARFRAEIELALSEECPPVRVVFAEGHVLVEDGQSVAPDVRVQGTLPDLVSLMVAPTVAGLPSPVQARGRAALGMVAGRRVRFRGRVALARRFLLIIRI